MGKKNIMTATDYVFSYENGAFESEGEKVSFAKYDQKGNEIKTTVFNDEGKISNVTKCFYNESGQLIKDINTNYDFGSSLQRELEYGTDKKLKVEKFGGIIRTYEYNTEPGKEEITISLDGTMVEKKIIIKSAGHDKIKIIDYLLQEFETVVLEEEEDDSHIQYEEIYYDEKGRVKKKIYKSTIQEFVYDADGNQKELIIFDSDGNPELKYITEYEYYD